MPSTRIRFFIALCIGIVIGASFGIEQGLLRPTPMEFGSPRFEGDSMVAGLNFDITTSMVSQVFDWRSDFVNAEVNGTSGARLETVLANANPSWTPIIVLLAGFNNVKHLDESEERIGAAYALLLFQLRQRSAITYCIAIPPMVHVKSNAWFPEGAEITNERILNINSMIKSYCGENYIDTPSFWTEADTNDGIHPNVQGYEKIVAELKHQKGISLLVPLCDFFLWTS